MTEAEALAQLSSVRDRASDRKLRLFACACCRRAWDWLDDNARGLVLLGERLADGLATNAERRTASKDAAERVGVHASGYPANYAFCGLTSPADHGAQLAVIHLPRMIAGMKTQRGALEARESRACRAEQEHQQELLRDITGDLIGSARGAPTWLTAEVAGMARRIYADRAFDLMPTLADLLQDAGCAEADVLEHCRGPGPHVRGCWVVDLVLGKG